MRKTHPRSPFNVPKITQSIVRIRPFRYYLPGYTDRLPAQPSDWSVRDDDSHRWLPLIFYSYAFSFWRALCLCVSCCALVNVNRGASIQFWRCRTVDLSGISEQLLRPDVQARGAVDDAVHRGQTGWSPITPCVHPHVDATNSLTCSALPSPEPMLAVP